MGVKGLWKLLSPTGRMVDIATLRGKLLAVDASIWLTQFLKAMRDEEGRMIQNGHIVGTLRRICKLLYHRIKVVFVFDGGVPLLKKRIMEKRRQRLAFDETRRQKAARGLLANQLLMQKESQKAKFIQSHGDEEEDGDEGAKSKKKQKVLGDKSKTKKQSGSAPTFVHSHVDEEDDEEDDDAEEEEEENEVEEVPAPPAKKKEADPLQDIMDFEDSEEEEDEESEDDLPYSIHDVDLATLQQLPKDKQYNMLVRLRESGGRDPRRREELLPVAGDPNQYSSTQLKHFLKDARRKKELKDMQKSLANQNSEAGSRIASDWTRQYSLILDKAYDPAASSTQPSSNGENKTLISQALPVYKASPTKATAAAVAAAVIQSAGKPSSVAKPAFARSLSYQDEGKFDDNDRRSRSRFPHLAPLQKECVERLYEGLNGVVDRETCLDMLAANQFRVKEVLAAFSAKVAQAPETKEKQEAKFQQDCIERLFEGLGETVDRSTCKALLMSCNWNVEETLLAFVEAKDKEEEQEQQKTTNQSKVVDLVSDDDNETSQTGQRTKSPKSELASEKSLVTDGVRPPPGDKPQKSGHLTTIKREGNGINRGPAQMLTRSSGNGERETGEATKMGIVDADVEADATGKLVFRFKPDDITVDSLSLFRDVFDSETKTKDANQEEDGIEWEEEEPRSTSKRPSENEPIEWETAEEGSSVAAEKNDKGVDSIIQHATEIPDPARAVEGKNHVSITEEVIDVTNHATPSLSRNLANANTSSRGEAARRNQYADETEEEERIVEVPRDVEVVEITDEDAEEAVEIEEDDTTQGGNASIISSEKALERALGISSNLTSWANSAVKRALKTHSTVAAFGSPKVTKTTPSTPKQQTPRSASTTTTNAPEGFSSPALEKLQEENKALRSEVKRAARDADTVTPEMRQDVMDLLTLFGFPFIESPMEAEAQCAALELAGIVDGVVTDDSDAFLFGARRVYKNIFTDRKNVEAYDVEDAETQFGFTREQYIYLALLMGSDYAEGIKGIGMVNAMEILTAFPGGKEGLIKFRRWVNSALLETEDDDDGEEEDQGKKRKKRKKKSTNFGIEEGDSEYTIQFKKSHARLRRKWLVHGDFPDDRVIQAYLRPTVHDFSSERQQQRLQWNEPDVDGIYRFCKTKLHWPDEKFEKEVLDPIRMFTSKKNIQTSMDQFVVRFEDRTRFAAIRSKRMAKAVHGIRSQQPGGDADDSIVAVDEMGNVISVADRAYGAGTTTAMAETADKQQATAPSKQEKDAADADKPTKKKRVVESSSSSSSEDEAAEDQDEEDEVFL